MLNKQTMVSRGKQSKAVMTIFAIFLCVAAVCTEQPVRAQKQSDLLEVGKPIERELKGDASHSYFVRMEMGQYLQAVVEQKGIDVAVTVYAPDEKKCFEIDSPNGAQGSEPVSRPGADRRRRRRP